MLDIWPVNSQACSAHSGEEQSAHTYHFACSISHRGFRGALSSHLEPSVQRYTGWPFHSEIPKQSALSLKKTTNKKNTPLGNCGLVGWTEENATTENWTALLIHSLARLILFVLFFFLKTHHAGDFLKIVCTPFHFLPWVVKYPLTGSVTIMKELNLNSLHCLNCAHLFQCCVLTNALETI